MKTTFNCVLLVDDDPTSNFLTDKMLLKFGMANHTHLAMNGERALDFLDEQAAVDKTLSEHWPELILLDINMPIMDGFEFLDAWVGKVFEDKVPPKVFLLTSSDSKFDLDKAQKYPIQGYINKPLSREKLDMLN